MHTSPEFCGLLFFFFWSYTSLGALWKNDESEILRFVMQKLQYEVAAVTVSIQKLPSKKKYNFSRAYISTRTLK